jgi:hypothetical protein
MAWLREKWPAQVEGTLDVLLCPGDVSDDVAILGETLRLLKSRFDEVPNPTWDSPLAPNTGAASFHGDRPRELNAWSHWPRCASGSTTQALLHRRPTTYADPTIPPFIGPHHTCPPHQRRRVSHAPQVVFTPGNHDLWVDGPAAARGRKRAAQQQPSPSPSPSAATTSLSPSPVASPLTSPGHSTAASPALPRRQPPPPAAPAHEPPPPPAANAREEPPPPVSAGEEPPPPVSAGGEPPPPVSAGAEPFEPAAAADAADAAAAPSAEVAARGDGGEVAGGGGGEAVARGGGGDTVSRGGGGDVAAARSGSDEAASGACDSLGQLAALSEVCRSLGVRTQPLWIRAPTPTATPTPTASHTADVSDADCGGASELPATAAAANHAPVRGAVRSAASDAARQDLLLVPLHSW